MASIVEEEGLSIQQWEVLAKENINPEKANEIAAFMEDHYPDASLSTEERDHGTKLIWNRHKNNDVSETYIIVIPDDSNYDYEFIFKLNGSAWNPSIVEYSQEIITTMKNHFFTENVTKFSCLKTQPNDKIDNVIFLENVLKNWNVQTLDEMKENDFVVLSGYTSRWETVIPTADKPMNIQLAARKGLGGKTTFTIGTPIIVTEY